MSPLERRNRGESEPALPRRRLGRLLLQLLELVAGLVGGGFGDQRRLDRALAGVLRNDALAHVAARRELELDVQERLLEDRAQAASADLALERLVGDRAERVR